MDEVKKEQSGGNVEWPSMICSLNVMQQLRLGLFSPRKINILPKKPNQVDSQEVLGSLQFLYFVLPWLRLIRVAIKRMSSLE